MPTDLEEIMIELQALDVYRQQIINGEGTSYEDCIRSYENLLRLVENCSRINERDITQLDSLKSRLRIELRSVVDLNNELDVLANKKPYTVSESVSDNSYSDPDVWPPPTAQNPNSRYDYERGSKVNNSRINNNNVVVSKRPQVSTPQDSRVNNERERKQRDIPNSAPSNAAANRQRKDGIPKQSAPPPTKGGKPGTNNKPGTKDQPKKTTNANGEKLKYSEIAKDEGYVDLPLIEGIERDIVEGKVNVKWETIAGLTEAKQLLQEAVVLPLWIPNFFKGMYMSYMYRYVCVYIYICTYDMICMMHCLYGVLLLL